MMRNSAKREYNPDHKKYILEQNGRCELCGNERPLEIHHIVPICAGGRDVFRNWIAICPQCHRKLTPGSELTVAAKRNNIWSFAERFYEYMETHEEDGIHAAFDYVDTCLEEING